MPARNIGPLCIDGCFGRIRTDGVEEMLYNIWKKIDDYKMQESHLQSVIKTVPAKRRLHQRTRDVVSSINIMSSIINIQRIHLYIQDPRKALESSSYRHEGHPYWYPS